VSQAVSQTVSWSVSQSASQSASQPAVQSVSSLMSKGWVIKENSFCYGVHSCNNRHNSELHHQNFTEGSHANSSFRVMCVAKALRYLIHQNRLPLNHSKEAMREASGMKSNLTTNQLPESFT